MTEIWQITFTKQKKLASLSGKKYHGKKNHVNKFKKLYLGWSYEAITDDNVEECFQMALKWRHINECDLDDEKRDEMCVTLNALRLMNELKLTGGLIRADGEVVAFLHWGRVKSGYVCGSY